MKNIKIIHTFFPISDDFAAVNYISLASKGWQKTAPTADTADLAYLSSADSWRLQMKQHQSEGNLWLFIWCTCATTGNDNIYIFLPLSSGLNSFCDQLEVGGRRKEKHADAEWQPEAAVTIFDEM